jgi:predicted Zn-dependent peptidase
MKASVILGLESNVNRMRLHVSNELNLKREVTIEEIVDDINRASVEDINRLFHDYMDLDNAAIFFYGDVVEK